MLVDRNIEEIDLTASSFLHFESLIHFNKVKRKRIPK